LLSGGRIGLEREALRVSEDGSLAQTSHPRALGSPLTHPWITTDFSEALIEFVTPPYTEINDALSFMRDTQTFVYGQLDQERLWTTSMPCILAGETSIPIARYGSSNAGFMKHVYRRGLGYRYGRVMQVIAGVHFNYSVNEALWPAFQGVEENTWLPQDFSSEAYFWMLRNLQRCGWLIPYLFGRSPAVCASYVGGISTDMELFDNSTYYYPYATSLRMGDIGYQNNKEYEVGFKACYDNLNIYNASLARATETPCPKYQDIGVVVDGEYRQLNANILQIENEYYSSVRPKQVPINNEKPTIALRERGVQYVELRSLDIDAYDPLGITEQQMRFLEAFMLYCLFQESPRINTMESREIDSNAALAANRGRDPSLRLQRNGQAISLRRWAAEICDVMQGICELLDTGLERKPYSEALALYFQSVEDPDLTPSARMLADMRERHEGFHDYASRLTDQHFEYFQALELSDDKRRFYNDDTQRSLRRQKDMERSDNITFDEYLQRYFAQY
jgi:glutamate--cysteine ligase